MINKIKSAIAAYFYQLALSSLASASPGQALGEIHRAIKFEAIEKYKPRYLSLQAEIEMELGQKDKAVETLKQAKQIIERYSEYWESESQKILSNRVKEALRDFQSK